MTRAVATSRSPWPATGSAADQRGLRHAWRRPGGPTRIPGRGAGVVVLLAALLALGACQALQPMGASASGHLPDDETPRRVLRPPSAERPPWLPSLPPDMQRFRVPDDGFRDNLG